MYYTKCIIIAKNSPPIQAPSAPLPFKGKGYG